MIFIVDPYYAVLNLCICIFWQMSFYALAAGLKIDKVTDFAYGTNFFALSIVTYCLNETWAAPRLIAVNLCVVIWAIRITAYLFSRILHIGEDKRFDEWRAKPLLFLRFWIFQLVSVFVVSFPYVMLNAKPTQPPLSWQDYLGWSLFVVGFIIETVADQVKFSYRNNAANKGHWCDAGVWSWSRHPNYFGEFLVWWGIWTSCSATWVNGDWASIICPVYLFLIIMLLSGPTRLEKEADKRYWSSDEYQRYKKRTSNLVTLPPPCYGALPRWIKWFFCEWPIYWNPPEEKKLTENGDKAADEPDTAAGKDTV